MRLGRGAPARSAEGGTARAGKRTCTGLPHHSSRPVPPIPDAMPSVPNYCAVPYEIRIRAAVIQARASGDHVSNLMLLNMLTLVAAGEFDQLRQAFDQLRPVYQELIGPPPMAST